MPKRIATVFVSPSPLSTLTWLGVDLKQALDDHRRDRLAVNDADRTAAALRLAAAVEAALPEIEDAKDKAREAAAIVSARAQYETAVEAGVEDWRFDGWLEYLEGRAADEREAMEAAEDDEREAAMAEWHRHAAEWDMCEF